MPCSERNTASLSGNSSYRPETTASVGAGSTLASCAGSNASPCSTRAMSAAPSRSISAWPWVTFRSPKSRSTMRSARCSPWPSASST
ncbi:hypothetical protein G6F68_019930 [Rhizopus microsporus]|nr:hypothetical protein G6F68_019930 [Rhizopus microsporus]